MAGLVEQIRDRGKSMLRFANFATSHARTQIDGSGPAGATRTRCDSATERPASHTTFKFLMHRYR
jgi:hypothetical protein